MTRLSAVYEHQERFDGSRAFGGRYGKYRATDSLDHLPHEITCNFLRIFDGPVRNKGSVDRTREQLAIFDAQAYSRDVGFLLGEYTVTDAKGALEMERRLRALRWSVALSCMLAFMERPLRNRPLCKIHLPAEKYVLCI